MTLGQLQATFFASAATFLTWGGFQLPSRISFFGQYSRMTRLNSSLGAGSQFDSLSLPGDSCWT